jgi:hypothetical protein
MSTMRFPVRVAICAWRESGAGIEAAPGSVRPSAAAAEKVSLEIAAQHRTGGEEDRRQVHRQRPHDERGRGLVASAHQHAAVGGIASQELLGLHREEVAIEHRGRLLEGLRERDRGHLDGESPGLPDAAFHLLGALAEVRVAGVDVAPRVDDRDDGLAEVVGAVVAHLRGARAMAEAAQILHPVPAVAAQLLGFFPGFHLAPRAWCLFSRIA